jgi:Holliday junction resolvase RusA-like endonuclease
MVTITIPGRPPTYRRARSNGKIRYHDKATIAERKRIAAVLADVELCPIDALSVEVLAIWPAPKSTPKCDLPVWSWRPMDPDADNVAKAILDGLQACGWLSDDNRVASISVRKMTSSTHGDGVTIVRVAALSDPPDARGVALYAAMERPCSS